MARRKKVSTVATSRDVVKIEPVLLDSARLLTVGPDAECWSGDLTSLDGADFFNGAFVRVRPPPGVSIELVDRVIAKLQTYNTASLRCTEVRKGKTPKFDDVKVAKAARPRNIVLAMINESHLKNKEQLKVKACAIMDKVGL